MNPTAKNLKIPIIAGPTASGKSTLAVNLATRLRDLDIDSQIISADSVQIFTAMDIGSAKPTESERCGFLHHLIDIISPTDQFTVSDWLSRADQVIDDLRSRDVLPIVVGGTHLYIKALLEGLFEGPEPDPEIRKRLTALDPVERRRKLEQLDPDAAARIHPNDIRRTVRALEIHEQTGTPISDHQQQWDAGRHRTDCMLLTLLWPVEELNARINQRVRDMMAAGLLEEIRTIAASPGFGPQSSQALGYKQLLAHLSGAMSLDEAVERIKIETRRFGKNQRTWIRRLSTLPDAHPLDGAQATADRVVELLMQVNER